MASMGAMSSPAPRRWLRWVLVAVALLLLAVGGAAAFVLLHKPGNVSHPDLSFTAPTTTTAEAPPPKKKKKVVDTFEWPRYGFDAARTRFFAGSRGLGPSLRRGWSFEDFALLEFPPVIHHSTLYVVDDDASAKAINKEHGHKLWEHKIGTLAAASPAIGVPQGLLYVSVLSDHSHTPGHGSIRALSLKNGHQVWSKPIPAGTESSPIAYGDTVYFGDQGGTMWALNARNGHVRWTYHASGAVKGGPALSDGILYFGDYAGRAYAVNARNGHQVWAVSTNGARFGFGSGNFYSTPAVAFGRVYMGNTDGRVYSFAARTGQLAWATGTSAYVYASAAVDDTPGLGPTIYLGSYDGTFYAFNAQSGAVRWRHTAGGRISGSATIVGGVVYYSDLGSRTTTGLDARTGRTVFRWPDGAFNPVVADYGAIYLTGYSKIYELLPKRRSHPAAAVAAAHRAARRSKARRKVRHAKAAAAKRRHRGRRSRRRK
jgi:outer membrane protein assembly factor BamB